jgi:hypothetical protein
MKTYFVRKTANLEVVGLFAAPSTTVLAALVDECCDPAICEFAPASAGGIIVAQATEARWPIPDGNAATTGLENAVFNQTWEDDLSQSTSSLEWRSLSGAASSYLRSLGRAAQDAS